MCCNIAGSFHLAPSLASYLLTCLTYSVKVNSKNYPPSDLLAPQLPEFYLFCSLSPPNFRILWGGALRPRCHFYSPLVKRKFISPIFPKTLAAILKSPILLSPPHSEYVLITCLRFLLCHDFWSIRFDLNHCRPITEAALSKVLESFTYLVSPLAVSLHALWCQSFRSSRAAITHESLLTCSVATGFFTSIWGTRVSIKSMLQFH